MSQRLGIVQAGTLLELKKRMELGCNVDEEIIFYSISTCVIGYSPDYVAIVTYQKKE